MVIWWDLVKVYRPLSEQWLKQVETSSLSWAFHPKLISTTLDMPALPILDTLQKNDKFFAGERRYSHWYQKTKGLKYPSKIDLACDCLFLPIYIWLVVSIPLKNMKASWDDYFQYMGK